MTDLRPVVVRGWKNDKRIMDFGYCFMLNLNEICIQHKPYLRGGPCYKIREEIDRIEFVTEELMIAERKLYGEGKG